MRSVHKLQLRQDTVTFFRSVGTSGTETAAFRQVHRVRHQSFDRDEIFSALKDINYKNRIVCEPFVMQGGEVGRDIKVFRDLIVDPTEAKIDAEAKYILDFEKAMLAKYGMA